MAELSGERLSKLETPLSDGFVADDDAPFGQDFFDLSEAEAKPMLQPHHVAHDLGWEAVLSIQTCGTRTHVSVTAYEAAA